MGNQNAWNITTSNSLGSGFIHWLYEAAGTLVKYSDWLADGRREVRERIENGDDEYEEKIKAENPYFYWSRNWTPDPPDEIVEDLRLNE